MCKYCELKNGECVKLNDEVGEVLIWRYKDEYYLCRYDNYSLEFKLKYCPECGRDIQKNEPLDERVKQIFISENISVTLLYRNGKIFAEENYHHDNEVIHKEIYRMDNINFDEPDIEYIKRIIKED